MGLHLDMEKQHSGNTNDGNTARVFFAEKPEQITGINIDIIKRFHAVLECLGLGFVITFEASENYADDAREMYLAPFHFISPSSTLIANLGLKYLLGCGYV